MSLESQNVRGVSIPTSPFLPALAALIGGTVRSCVANVSCRRAVAGLTDRQLADTGIERSAVLGDRPTIEIEPGVMGYLMSLR